MARWEWAGRWGGAACAVAGCMPMLAALAAGVTGAAGAEVAGAARSSASAMTSATMMMPVMGAATGGTSGAAAAPGWVAALGDASWPLLIVAAGLLVWSFWRTPGAARVVAYAGVALLIVNQMHMRSWLFLPAMALVAGGFALSYAASRRVRASSLGGPEPDRANPGRDGHAPA